MIEVLHGVFLTERRASSWVIHGSLFTAVCRAFSSCGNRGLLCCHAQAFHRGAFSCCRAEAAGARASVAVAHGIRSLQAPGAAAHGLQLPTARGVIRIRGRAHVPCTGRWVLSHCTPREVLFCFFQSHAFPLTSTAGRTSNHLHKLFIQIFFFFFCGIDDGVGSLNSNLSSFAF